MFNYITLHLCLSEYQMAAIGPCIRWLHNYYRFASYELALALKIHYILVIRKWKGRMANHNSGHKFFHKIQSNLMIYIAPQNSAHQDGQRLKPLRTSVFIEKGQVDMQRALFCRYFVIEVLLVSAPPRETCLALGELVVKRVVIDSSLTLELQNDVIMTIVERLRFFFISLREGGRKRVRETLSCDTIMQETSRRIGRAW